MAMTKKERAEMEQLRHERDLALALRFRSEPIPERMTTDPLRADRTLGLLRGWSPHFPRRLGSAFSIRPGCFDTVSHSCDYTHKTTSRTAGTFYATREDALISLRHEATVECAELLARIDAEIEKERANPTPIPDTTPKKGPSNG